MHTLILFHGFYCSFVIRILQFYTCVCVCVLVNVSMYACLFIHRHVLMHLHVYPNTTLYMHCSQEYVWRLGYMYQVALM